MATFSIKTVETLDYDFRGIPKDGPAKGYCSGKGTVPEPSTADLEAYQATMKEITVGRSLEDLAQADTKEQQEQLHKTLEATAEFCKGTPSLQELEELPPRMKIAFIRWLGGEISNPEV